MVRKPLEGITVLDFTWALSGPFCTMILCDLGARVLKVESPTGGDPVRKTLPVKEGESGYYCSVNRGKESLAIDLRQKAGKELIERLVPKVDILVENFRPGTMDGLDLGYSHLSSINPRLIYLAISGFGQTGPLAVRPAFDLIVQALGGVMGVTGYPDGEPVRAGVSQGDMTAAIYGSMLAMVGLYRRNLTGQGMYVDLSMLEAQVSLMFNQFAMYSVTGVEPKRIGNRHPSSSLFDQFPCSDGNIILVTAFNDQWVRCCEALGIPEIATDKRFENVQVRNDNIEELTGIINARTKTRTYAEWAELMEAYEVPFGKVNSVKDLLNEEQLRERETIVELNQPKLGKLLVPGPPYKIGGFDLSVKKRAPLYGEHTDSALKDLLGLSDKEVKALHESRAIV